jgi:hypothetical protein
MANLPFSDGAGLSLAPFGMDHTKETELGQLAALRACRRLELGLAAHGPGANRIDFDCNAHAGMRTCIER